MKKYIALFILPLVVFASSCNEWIDEVATSPNSPTEVTPDLLLTVSEVAMQTLYTGQLSRTSSILIQHCAGNDFQMLDVRDYEITELSNINEWSTVYADALINQQTLIDIAGDENPYYRGIATILKCMTIGLATDFWGDIPYSAALQGLDGTDAALNPAYDTQESIYSQMQSQLDGAIADLSADLSANALIPGSDDIIHNGDVSLWIKAAYMLKARYANHRSQIDAAGSATEALDAIAAAGLTSNADNTNAIFGIAGNELNPWFSFNTTRANYIKMGAFTVDLLESLADPRLPLYATLDNDGGYSGPPVNGIDNQASDVGSLYATDASPLPLLTYYEMKFIEAEAKLRSGDAAGAATAHNDAVKANLLATLGAPDAVYEAANASETAGTITLDKIMTQKYIAMFLQTEAWADWRRTGLPALTPNPDGVWDGIPLRFPTCINERLYNSNYEGHYDLLEPVWFDAD
jgi:hypothetical protein